MYVDDLAKGVLFLLTLKDPPNWVNLGTGIDHSIFEIAEIVKKLLAFKALLKTI